MLTNLQPAFLAPGRDPVRTLAALHAKTPESPWLVLGEVPPGRQGNLQWAPWQAGCPCCTGSLPFRTLLVRHLRHLRPDRIWLLLNPAHLNHLDTLVQDPWLVDHLHPLPPVALATPDDLVRLAGSSPAWAAVAGAVAGRLIPPAHPDRAPKVGGH